MAIQSLSLASGGGNAVALPPQPARNAEAAALPGQSQAAAAQPPQKPEPSLEEVKNATNAVQQVVQAKASNLTFAVGQDEGKTVVKLMDKQSGEVILQIPSKEMIAIADQIDKIVGMFVQQKA